MAQRKTFPLRLDPVIYDELQRWASAELRSLNGQIEYLLRRALQESGRLPSSEPVNKAQRSDAATKQRKQP